MKISCQSCGAKYTIADDKVVGKIVKIRCKKCSSTIVINGNDSAALAAGGADSSALPEYAPTAAISGEPWTVNVGDGDQRTLSMSEIVQLYKSGEITDETYCWKDGMADWLPIREIDQLYNACTVRSTLEPDTEVPQSERGANAGAAGMFGGGSPATDDAPTMMGGDVSAAIGNQTAARRVGGRNAGGADLFGAAAKAGGEDDVMTSAPMSGNRGGGGGGGSLDEPKLTGQRNENSVLFSLSALTKEAPEPTSGKVTEGSGLIDIRALASAPKSADNGRSAKVDDIMNLGGGGAFSAALAAPVLAAPALDMGGVDPYAPGANNQGGGNNKTLLLGLLGGGGLIAAAIVVVMLMKGGDKTPPVATGTLPTGSAIAMNDPNAGLGTTPTAPTGVATAPAPTDTTAPVPAAPGTGAPPVAPGGRTAAPGGRTASRTNPGGGGDPTPDPTPAPATPPKPAQSLAGAIAAAGGGDTSSSSGGGGGSSAPFDRGAAAAALGAVNVASCKKADGPTGSGHIAVTFAPNGSVSTAVVDSPPFDGTSVGGCVAGKFRGAHIPSFAGSAVKVGKSFTIN